MSFDMSQLLWPGGTIQLRAVSAQVDRPAWSDKILIFRFRVVSHLNSL